MKNSRINGIVEQYRSNLVRKSKDPVPFKEQNHGKTLAEMGKQAYFVEYLYEIAPIDQDYSNVEGYQYAIKKFTKEEMIETTTFKKGYNYAEAMAKSGVVPDRYKEAAKKHR